MAEHTTEDLINIARLEHELAAAGLDAVVATSPESTYYLSGCYIRTQISIRDRLACVIWPASGPATFLVCNIEESLARAESPIEDVRTYVEFAQSPIEALANVLRDRGLAAGRIGIEERFLTRAYHSELVAAVPSAELVAADALLERVRAIKTKGEVERIRACFVNTEAAIRDAWAASRAGDTEKQVADRMIEQISVRGATGARHITLASGENTVHPHMYPSARRLRPGDTVLTDFGGTWDGFSSDMARMGVVGAPGATERDEYARYREAYVETLHRLGPGVTAAEVYGFCQGAFEKAGIRLTSPHVGHSLSRGGGHDNPILHPFNHQQLQPGMLIALEPTFLAAPTRRYHIEDLVHITEDGAEVLTDWASTERMYRIPS